MTQGGTISVNIFSANHWCLWWPYYRRRPTSRGTAAPWVGKAIR